MNTLPLQLQLESILVNAPLCFKIKVNNIVYYDREIKTHQTSISVDIPDSRTRNACSLSLELYGKTDNNTVINNGIMVETASITIKSLCIDDIPLITNKLINDSILGRMKYIHDNNGRTSEMIEPFTRNMGCNGVQLMDMYTPLHIWLYETVY